MKRTHAARAARPQSAAPDPATASMVTGCEKRSATNAPAHSPTYEAPHARSGVRSHPHTTSRWASQRGTRPSRYALRARAKTTSAGSVTAKPAPAITGSAPSSPDSRATTASTTAPISAGAAVRAMLESAGAVAVRVPPIHARNVANIHQIGRYHHVLPPPTASQVHG